MRRSRVVLAEALVAAAALVAASCGGAEQRASRPPSSGATASPTGTASSGPTGSPVPSPSASTTGSPTQERSDRTWHRSFDFAVHGVAADVEGNAYVTGLAPSGPAEEWGEPMEMVLAKVDPGGQRVWLQRWRSTSRRYPDAVGFDVAVSADGGVLYVAGEIMLPPWEATRPYLWAYSSAGELLWSRPTARYGWPSAAAAGSTGVVVGGSDSVGAFGPDGDRLWVEPFEEPSGEHCDAVDDVAIGAEGEIYAAGFLDTTPTCGSIEGGDYQDADVVVQQRAASGDLVWSTVLDDPGVTDNDWARAVAVAGDEVFVAGEVDGSAWLALVSPGGAVVWERSWGDDGATVGALDAAPWDAVYVASSSGLRRFTPEGDLTWERRVRLDDEEAVSGLASAPGRVLYVAAGGGFSVWTGDLWRTRP